MAAEMWTDFALVAKSVPRRAMLALSPGGEFG